MRTQEGNIMAWPKEVDVLSARNIHRGGYEKNNTCRCAIGWMGFWFGFQTKEYKKAKLGIKKEIGTWLLVQWNDNPKNTKADIARTINKVTAALGYTEGNPEA